MDAKPHYSLFTPRVLTLAITTVVTASQPATLVIAAETSVAPCPRPEVRQCTPTPQKDDLPLSEWQPIDQLSPERQALEPFYSCGAYIEPARPDKDYVGNQDLLPIRAWANESTFDHTDVAHFTGDVTVRQGSRQLESDKAYLDQVREYGQFEGGVIFRDKGVLITGDKAELFFDSSRTTMEHSAYVLHEQKARGNAGSAVRNKDETLKLTNATYTTCPPGDNGWLLSGRDVTLDQQNGTGVAKGAVVRVQNLPILYTPYISFPIGDRRKSGFLFPSLSEGSDNGLDFSIPYYLNLAPNYDATLTPRYMSKRGFMLESQFRYLFGNSRGEWGAAGLLNKDQQEWQNPFYDQRRWLLNIRHTTNISSNWTAEVDFARASDKEYLEDFSSDLSLSGSAQLNQRASTRYLGGDVNHSWQLSLDAHQYQNMSMTADDPYNKLPHIRLTGNWLAGNSVALSDLTVNYEADFTRFTRAENWDYRFEELVDPGQEVYQSIYGPGYGIDRANGDRLYLESGISLPLQRSYGFLKPAIKVQSVQYRLSNLIDSDVIVDLSNSYQGFTAGDLTTTPRTTVPTFSVDGGLYFDRYTRIGGIDFTHTLEPRVKYLYSPFVEGQEMHPIFDTALLGFNYHSLWRDSRFTGHDRLGDAHQVSLGLVSRLLEDDGFERARFGIGQIIYLDDRQLWINPLAGSPKNQVPEQDDWDINLNDEGKRLWAEMHTPVSPLASELRYNFNRHMSIQQDLMWDTKDNELDSYNVYYQYQPDYRRVLNVGYRYLPRAERFVQNAQNGLVPDPTDPTGYRTASNDISQSDLSFAWPMSKNWSALGRWQYDFTNNQNLEFLAGVEYNSCCYRVRLLWRKWIDDNDNIDFPEYKDGLVLQFVLRGLSSLSSGSSKEYLEGIRGYAGDY